MKIIQKTTIVSLLIAMAAATSLAQTLNSDEKKVAAYVDANTEAAISFLERTVNIESATEDLAGVRSVGKLFWTELEAIGFKVRWIDMPPEMKRAGHLIAERTGTKGKRILLLGHLDTVLKGEKFRREGKLGYGTGTADMKSGDVVLLYALKALASSDLLKDTTITVMFTGDEENSGDPESISRGEMVEAAKKSDLVLSFETGIPGTATVARRGASTWTLEVTGNTGHSSGIFGEQMGSGAIFEASRILSEFYGTLKGEKYLTFNPALFVGGTEASAPDFNGRASGKDNVVPGKAVVHGDLRFISAEQLENTRKKMRDIVAKSLPGTSARITFFDGIPAMSPSEANLELLRKLDQVSRDLGFEKIEPYDPGKRGAGDISYVTHLIPGLDGLGAMGGKTHAAGEFAELETFPTQIKRAAVLIYRLTR